MMKMINRKFLTGTLAASVLLGGGLTTAIYSKAFAAADGTSTSAAAAPAAAVTDTTGSAAAPAAAATDTTGSAAADSTAPNDHGPGMRGGHDGFGGINVEQQAAAVLGVDEATIRDQQAQGKTLSQIAQDKGVTEDVLLQKLTDAANTSIDAAVTAGTMTQAQADQQKAGLADYLKQEVAELEQNEGHGHGKGGGHFDSFADPAAVSQILGMTQTELNTELQAGKSLTEIADAKGIAKDQLIGKIKDSLTEKITQFVDRKQTNTNTPVPAASNSSDTAAN